MKKMGLLFFGSGTPTFWLGLLLFIKREPWTPTFKILVRTLLPGKLSCWPWQDFGHNWVMVLGQWKDTTKTNKNGD